MFQRSVPLRVRGFGAYFSHSPAIVIGLSLWIAQAWARVISSKLAFKVSALEASVRAQLAGYHSRVVGLTLMEMEQSNGSIFGASFLAECRNTRPRYRSPASITCRPCQRCLAQQQERLLS